MVPRIGVKARGETYWNFSDVHCVLWGMNIQGRVGGSVTGYDLNLELESLSAVIAFKMLEDAQSSSAASSGSS